LPGLLLFAHGATLATVARSATILLAEDDPNDAKLVGVALQRSLSGVPLIVVNDGIELINYLQGQGKYADRRVYPFPELVLLDLKMPRMDGFEVLRWLRQQPILKRLPVIVLTNSSQDADAEMAYDAGANSYLVKPTRFEDLVKTMQLVGDFWLSGPMIPNAVPPA